MIYWYRKNTYNKPQIYFSKWPIIKYRVITSKTTLVSANNYLFLLQSSEQKISFNAILISSFQLYHLYTLLTKHYFYFPFMIVEKTLIMMYIKTLNDIYFKTKKVIFILRNLFLLSLKLWPKYEQ